MSTKHTPANVRAVEPVRDLYIALRYAERKPFNAAEIASVKAEIAAVEKAMADGTCTLPWCECVQPCADQFAAIAKATGGAKG